jgi:DNA topoisomerase IB
MGLPDNTKVLDYRRLADGGLVTDYALVERQGLQHFLYLQTGSGLSLDVRASGPAARALFQQEVDTALRGAGTYSSPATVLATRLDAEGERRLKAFWSPMVGIDWSQYEAQDAEEVEAQDFHKHLLKQLKNWKGGYSSLPIRNHSYWPTFQAMVAKALGSMPRIYRGVHGEYAKAILEGRPMAIRELSAWTTSLRYAKDIAQKSSTLSDRNRFWFVAQSKKYKLKDVAFAPVILPDYGPDPKVLFDALQGEDEIVIFDPSKSLKTGDYKVVAQTRSKLVQRVAARSQVEDFVEGFFRRFPALAKHRPRKVLPKNGGGGEARQSGDEIWIYPKFWNLPPRTQDFVFAHELGHYVLSKRGLANLIQDAARAGVDLWDPSNLPFGQLNMEEAFADAFASFHTAPGELKSRHPEWVPLVKTAARYKDKKVSDEGNTIYMYSEQQVARRNNEKAKRLEQLRKNVHKVRDQVKKDLKSDDPEKSLTALAVGLMDHTAERVGNDASAKDGHFGVTGWKPEHIKFSGGKATVSYVGKSGVKQKKTVTDKALVSALKDAVEACDGESSIFCHPSATVKADKVNAYLKKFDITAKDLRGLHANQVMQKKLKAVRKGELPSDKKEREKKLKDEFKKALEETAAAVGHEPATLRGQYLVPGLEDEYMKGRVMEKMTKKASARRVAERYLKGK